MTLRSPQTALPLAVLLLAAALPAAPALAQYGGERSGTAGFQSLQVPVDPRGAALAQAAVSMADDASALFWNPALAAQATATRPYVVGLATTRYHAETALHYAAGIARVRSPLGTLSVGLSLQAFDAGEMEETTELQPGGTGRTFGYGEWAAGLTVSQSLTDLFSYGVTAKYLHLSTAEITAQTAVVDLGVFYRVGETGASLGVAIRNFGVADATPKGEVEQIRSDGTLGSTDTFERITPPTQFLLGLSYDALRTEQHALTVAAQLANPADNQERVSLAAEYTWSRTVALRGGYLIGQDEGSLPSFGVGFFVPEFGGPALRVDYGFAQRDRLGPVHRVGLDVRF